MNFTGDNIEAVYQKYIMKYTGNVVMVVNIEKRTKIAKLKPW